MRVIKEEAIAVAIDYQERLVPAMYEKERLIENSCILLAGLRELKVPTVFTQQYTKGLGMTVSEITEAAGTEEYLEKISFSAFETVKQAVNGKKFVILCGMEAHICVLQTAIDLIEEGYIPVLVADCISSRKKYNIDAALERAVKEGAILTTYEAILFELLKEAGTPTSKVIQRLVK